MLWFDDTIATLSARERMHGRMAVAASLIERAAFDTGHTEFASCAPKPKLLANRQLKLAGRFQSQVEDVARFGGAILTDS